MEDEIVSWLSDKLSEAWLNSSERGNDPMNEPLQASEETIFDPLMLLDDDIETLDNDGITLEPIDEIDDPDNADDADDEDKKIGVRKKTFPNQTTDFSQEIPPFQRDQELLFRELIDQHQRRLYRFVIKYIDHPDDAADITQQAFVEAARTISSFRGDSKLSTWLFGIAMNMVRNYIRKMIEQDLYELPVLSFQELTQEINIQPLARVEL